MIDDVIKYNDDIDFALGILAGGDAVQYNQALIDELNLKLNAQAVNIYAHINTSASIEEIKYWEGQRAALEDSIKAINQAFNIIGERLDKKANFQLDGMIGGDA